MLEGLRSSKRRLALNWDQLLFLSIDIDLDCSSSDTIFDTAIYELDVCVWGMFVDDPERWQANKKLKTNQITYRKKNER